MMSLESEFRPLSKVPEIVVELSWFFLSFFYSLGAGQIVGGRNGPSVQATDR